MSRAPQLSGRALFAAVAPRLERAHRERLEELARERIARRAAGKRLLHCRWLVAHRDLQYQRACAKRGANGYAAKRLRLLEEARGELVRAEQRAAELGIR